MKSWKKLSSKIVHENPWFRLCEDNVSWPDGKRGKYFYVDGWNSVAILPVDEKGHIYLVRQKRYTMNNFPSWEVAGGRVEKGDSFLTTAKKELKQELGISARQWIELGEAMYEANGFSKAHYKTYVAKDLVMGKQELDHSEDIVYKKFSPKMIVEMIINGEIRCGWSLAILYRYELYKQKNK